MLNLRAEQLPLLGAALMRLRGETLRSVGAATGIRAANLSVWLRGKEQVISAKRVAELLYYLGVQGGHLRTDVLHHWRDTGPLDDVKTVLGVMHNGTTLWLFQDMQPGLTKTRYLRGVRAVRADEVWIKLELTPGIAVATDLADVVCAQRVLTLPVALAGIPTPSLQAASAALLELASTAAADVGDEELLEGLMFKLSEETPSMLTGNSENPDGWAQLEQAFQLALKRGIDPGEIAALIADSYNKRTS